jgi:hypothetical protein
MVVTLANRRKCLTGRLPGVSPPVFGPQWTTPRPPGEAEGRPIRGWRVTAGIGLAMLGHAVIAAVAVLVSVRSHSPQGATIVLPAEAVLLAVCLTLGVVLLVRGDRGLGLGLIVGWAGAMAVAVVVGVLGLFYGVYGAIAGP